MRLLGILLSYLASLTSSPVTVLAAVYSVAIELLRISLCSLPTHYAMLATAHSLHAAYYCQPNCLGNLIIQIINAD
jgi:hypothetical protein